MSVTIEEIKSVFEDVLDRKFTEFRLSMLPYISNEEMYEITKINGLKPDHDNDFEEMNFEFKSSN